jgi:hypothetical protein
VTVLRGRVAVGAPPEVAWRAFTPEGERAWAGAGWAPRYPVPTDDDSAPGTVFLTGGDGHHPVTTWVVVARDAGRRMGYARVVDGLDAGTVTVELAPDGRGGSEVAVTYALTATSAAGGEHLAAFAAGYDDYLGSWQRELAAVRW